MGHTNSTVNYNLPQFVGTDKPSWLGDVNGAFLAIDTAIAAAKTEADSAAGGEAGLQVNVGGHTTQIGALSDAVTSQGGTLNSVTKKLNDCTSCFFMVYDIKLKERVIGKEKQLLKFGVSKASY